VQIVSLLKKTYGVEGAIQALREIGYGCAETLWKYKKPERTKSLPKLINDTVNIAFYYDVVVKKREDGLLIIDKNCPICWEGVVEKDIPYCCIVDGFLERYFVFAHEEYGTPRAQVHAVKSKATGDEQCEHLCIILDKETGV
jgi:predicted hydrocarbon binding protein